MDVQEESLLLQGPTTQRPLLGLTILMVEDSRFASEAVRLMCLRSGARIRRADSIAAAERHLAVYRPSVLLVDLGLPDGSGLSLIRTAASATHRIDVILGTSGDAALCSDALRAGADGFIAKPVDSLVAFQGAILQHLPDHRQRPMQADTQSPMRHPDPVAYQDDLNHIARILRNADGEQALDYVTQFLGGVARSAHDHDLDAAVTRLAQQRQSGANPAQGVAALSQMVQARIAAAGLI